MRMLETSCSTLCGLVLSLSAISSLSSPRLINRNTSSSRGDSRSTPGCCCLEASARCRAASTPATVRGTNRRESAAAARTAVTISPIGRVPGEEAGGSGPDDALDFIPVRGLIPVRRNDEGKHPRRGAALEDCARRLRPFEIRQPKTHQHHVWPQLGCQLHARATARSLRNHLDVRLLSEQRRQAAAKEIVTGHNQNADPRAADRRFIHDRPFPLVTIVWGRCLSTRP